jgi:CheY-like chemotaxis protein
MPALQEPSSPGLDVSALLAALTAFKKGDFSVRLPLEWTGLPGKGADAFNAIVEHNERLAAELERMSRVVGKEGKLAERADLGDVRGGWGACVESVNALVGDLVHPTSETARVIGAVAQGDLSQTMALENDDRPLQGEFLRTAKTINRMVDQLSSFASEVTRVAREVGTEGKLGGQAQVRGVAGTGQVRNIAEVTTAVANGDLKQKLTVEAKGEIAALAACEEFRPRVVLLDIGLPDLDGYEVARILRGRPASCHTLLVALTGYGEDDPERVREAGFDRLLTKPVDPEELVRLLEPE